MYSWICKELSCLEIVKVCSCSNCDHFGSVTFIQSVIDIKFDFLDLHKFLKLNVNKVGLYSVRPFHFIWTKIKYNSLKIHYFFMHIENSCKLLCKKMHILPPTVYSYQNICLYCRVISFSLSRLSKKLPKLSFFSCNLNFINYTYPKYKGVAT